MNSLRRLQSQLLQATRTRERKATSVHVETTHFNGSYASNFADRNSNVNSVCQGTGSDTPPQMEESWRIPRKRLLPELACFLNNSYLGNALQENKSTLSILSHWVYKHEGTEQYLPLITNFSPSPETRATDLNIEVGSCQNNLWRVFSSVLVRCQRYQQNAGKRWKNKRS